MSQARIMTIALNRQMAKLKEQVAELNLSEKVAVYLRIVRENERRIDGLGPAITNCCRNAILAIYGEPHTITTLSDKMLTNEERLKCFKRKSDIRLAAFNKWLALEAKYR